MRRIISAAIVVIGLLLSTPSAHAWPENGKTPTWSMSAGWSSAAPLEMSWAMSWDNLNVWAASIVAVGPQGVTLTRSWTFDGRTESGHLEGAETMTEGYWEVDFYLVGPNGEPIHTAKRGVSWGGNDSCYGNSSLYGPCP